MNQEQYDTHDPKGHSLFVLPFLLKRAKVIEIVAARGIVFALVSSGVCAAFSRGKCANVLLENLFIIIIMYMYIKREGSDMKVLTVHDPIADTNKRICLLNIFPDEVIRSLFYNKNNDSLITVSVYASDHFSSLKCRSTRIE